MSPTIDPQGVLGLVRRAKESPADPSVVVDVYGNVHAVWQDKRSGLWQIYASVLPAGARPPTATVTSTPSPKPTSSPTPTTDHLTLFSVLGKTNRFYLPVTLRRN